MMCKSNQNLTTRGVKSDHEGQTKKQTALAHVLSYLKEYCKRSGIHGLSYLSEDNRNCFERLFWAMAILIGAIGCWMMISAIKTKMDTTPTIVTMVENPTKVWHVPFPAVTICPDSQTRLTAFNLTKFVHLSVTNHSFLEDFLKWINESKTSKDKHDSLQISNYNEVFDESSWVRNSTLRNSLYKKLWALHTIRSGYFDSSVEEHSTDVEGTLALDEDDMGFFLEVAPIMNTNWVFWKNNTTFLDAHFKHLWTDKGLCFTFNMMDNIHLYRDALSEPICVIRTRLIQQPVDCCDVNFCQILQDVYLCDSINNDLFKRRGLDKNFPKSSNDWDPDEGYTVLRRQTYPWRSPHERQRGRNCLVVGMMEFIEDIFEYWGKETYAILFHQPQDHPVFFLNNDISIPLHKRVDITVKIGLMTTSQKLLGYAPHKRQCYYSSEKYLKYFKLYSQSNCQLECMTNISFRMCGCVAFYMPRDRTTKICGGDADKCLADAMLQSDESEMDAAFKYLSRSGKSPFNSPDSQSDCDCLPSCLSISYEAEVLTTQDIDSAWFDPSDVDVDPKKLVQTAAYITLKNSEFTASQRSEFYGAVDFLANCGGFLGLFCGISTLSFIEIIYFLTIRLWTNVYRRLSSKPSPERPEVILDAD